MTSVYGVAVNQNRTITEAGPAFAGRPAIAPRPWPRRRPPPLPRRRPPVTLTPTPSAERSSAYTVPGPTTGPPWTGTAYQEIVNGSTPGSVWPPDPMPQSAFGFNFGWSADIQGITQQTYSVTDNNNWSASCNLGDNNGGIMMFPCMTWPSYDQYVNTGIPIGHITQLHYQYGLNPVTIDGTLWTPGAANSVYDWDWMLDIWIDDSPSGGGQWGTELMVWFNWSKGWTMPYPFATANGTTTITGTDPSNPTTAETWYWWRNGNPTGTPLQGGTIAVAQAANAFNGIVDLAPIFQWVIANNYAGGNCYLQTIECGTEVSSTHNAPTLFQCTAAQPLTFVHT